MQNKIWELILDVTNKMDNLDESVILDKVVKLYQIHYDRKIERKIVSDIIAKNKKFDQSGLVSNSLIKSNFESNLGRFQTSHITYLLDRKKGKSFKVADVEEIQKTTNNVIREIFQITDDETQVKKYGLVFGQVQSGKTTHYSMLINKAMDNGIHNIIILTSDNVRLNIQTHDSIVEHVIGKGRKGQVLGVGEFQNQNQFKNKVGLLSEKDKLINTDITKNWDTFENRIIVARKNVNVMDTLLSVLNNRNIDTKSSPWLIIDDEADYASMDTTTRDDAKKRTSINRRINKIVNDIVEKVAFVGYTATPFANLLMQEDRPVSIRPQFLQYIKPGLNYNGAKKYFLNENQQNFIEADLSWSEADDTMKRHLLRESILAFAVDSASKQLNSGQDKFVMTINIAHTIPEHTYIKKVITEIFLDFKSGYSGAPAAIKKDLYKIIKDNYEFCPPHFELAQKAQDFLGKLILENNVHIMNSKEDYEPEGSRNILIGGFKFGRGLTIENLTFFYIDRTSKNYDTILQQARWFGYRKTNPTLYLPLEYYKTFQSASLATMELINQIGQHDDTLDSFYPKMKVYSKLSPTSLNKTGSRQKYLGTGNSYKALRKMANKVLDDKGVINHNKNVISEFITGLIKSEKYVVTKSSGDVGAKNGTLLIKGVEIQKIEHLLMETEFLDLSNLFISQMVESVKKFENKKFTIAIPSGQSIDNDWLKGFNLKMQGSNIKDTTVFKNHKKNYLSTNGVGKPTDFKSDDFKNERNLEMQRGKESESLIIIYTAHSSGNSINFIGLELAGGDSEKYRVKHEYFYIDGTPIEKILIS